MSRAVCAVVIAVALAGALALRLIDPAARPMHHDEANQAVRFGILLETGDYRYDPQEHHGPTLYYLTLPLAWARGQHSLAALDERTLRMVPAAFGAGLLLLFPFLSRGLGRPAVATAALLAAASPVLTYYSRFYIQETLLAFFAVAFLVAAGRYAQRPRASSAAWAGAAAGLAYATKETSLIVLPVAALACLAAAAFVRSGEGAPRPGARGLALHALAAVTAAAVPVVLLYTAFFRHPSGVLDAIAAVPVYLGRGVEPEAHVQPWWYYLRTLAWSSSGGLVWSEMAVLALAGVGFVHAWRLRRREFWPLYLALYTLVMTAILSALPYKTPWNVLPFYTGMVLMGGIGAAGLLQRVRARPARAILVVTLALVTGHLAALSVRASVRYPADERNPWAYAQTSPDYLRLAARVRDLAAVHPDGRGLLVKVIAAPHEQWPFPWYARELRQVGYWTAAADAGSLDGVPVILASQQEAEAVAAAVGERYVSEFYGLRPNVLVTLFIERGLWERFLASRQGARRTMSGSLANTG
jgi:uncharacterized protein (TIGR03663 family)